MRGRITAEGGFHRAGPGAHAGAKQRDDSIIAVTNNGARIFEPSTDGIRLFDPATLLQLGPPLPVAGPIGGLAFSADGKSVISTDLGRAGGRDNLQSWVIDPTVLVSRACGLAGRSLSLGEWQKYAGSEFPYAPVCAGGPPLSKPEP